jgi:hypothetical protein
VTRIAPAFDPADPRHGTVNGYVNLHCRCDECREAWRTYPAMKASQVRYRRRMGMLPRKLGRTHGIRATYNRGCRCDECRRAESEYKRTYRQRQTA